MISIKCELSSTCTHHNINRINMDSSKKESSSSFPVFGSNFGQQSSTTPSNGTQVSFGSFQFGNPTTTAPKSEATTSSTTGFGFSFGDQSSKINPPSTGFSFGSANTTTNTNSTIEPKPVTETKTPLFSFSSQPISTQNVEQTSSSDKDKKDKPVIPLEKVQPTIETKQTNTIKDFTTTATPTIQSTIQNKTLDEIIQKWVKELDVQVKLFHQRAIELNKWDKLLMEHGSKIAQLYDVVIQAETMQTELDQNLDYLASQQNELAGMLTLLENDVKKIYEQPPPTATGTDASVSDSDREKMFSIAESIDTDLFQLKQGVTNLNEQLNSILQPKALIAEESEKETSNSVS